ncbi:MAG: HAD hydrolase-like protein [Opitutae bacterium]|nr:HAD hydrolase-like protein [Opitutae bacterium]
MSNKWITFDCFGTLVDWHRGFADILRPVAGSRTAELVKAYHQFERPLEIETPHRLYRDVLRQGVARAAAKIDLPLTDAQKESLPERWGTQSVFADVEPALAELRAAGWKLAVLTNCDLDLFAQTHRAFKQPFDLVVTAEQVKDYKPSLAHFHYFRRVSGVEFGQWIHAACSFYHDIGPAKQLGIRRIWIDRDNTGENPAAATLRITSVAELPGAVARITKA